MRTDFSRFIRYGLPETIEISYYRTTDSERVCVEIEGHNTHFSRSIAVARAVSFGKLMKEFSIVSLDFRTLYAERMAENKSLLIVYHSQSGNTGRLAEAVVAGAQSSEISGVDVRVTDPLSTSPALVESAAGIILGTPENFGYMSGAMKYFFDHIYYPCLDHTQGKPYAMFVRAGNDGSGAVSSIQKITTGLRWREVAPPLVVKGEINARILESCEELGMSLAAGLEAGIF